jgi:MFS family permease
MHVVKVLVSERAGAHADRIGRRPLILLGWSVYAVTLLALAFAHSPPALWGWSLALGLYFGLTEGTERAQVADLAAPDARGTAFGWFHMIVGLAAVPAGLTLGSLWSAYGVTVAFLVSAAVAAVATAGLWRVLR